MTEERDDKGQTKERGMHSRELDRERLKSIEEKSGKRACNGRRGRRREDGSYRGRGDRGPCLAPPGPSRQGTPAGLQRTVSLSRGLTGRGRNDTAEDNAANHAA